MRQGSQRAVKQWGHGLMSVLLSMGDGSSGAGQLREAVRRLRPDPGER